MTDEQWAWVEGNVNGRLFRLVEVISDRKGYPHRLHKDTATVAMYAAIEECLARSPQEVEDGMPG